MPNRILPALLSIAMTLPGAVNAQESEGRRLAELGFQSIDGAEKGYVDLGDFSNFGSVVFISMDTDENGRLSLYEFLNWGFGLQNVAEDAGRADELETAMRVVFAFWDRNGDNEISRTEHRQSLVMDFQRADLNNNAVLTQDEFLNGFSVMIATRAAINPPPVE